MNTMIDSKTQISGSSLQVELKNASSTAVALVAAACPADVVASASTAPVYTSQLRGYTR